MTTTAPASGGDEIADDGLKSGALGLMSSVVVG